jgi:hypothetical protein
MLSAKSWFWTKFSFRQILLVVCQNRLNQLDVNKQSLIRAHWSIVTVVTVGCGTLFWRNYATRRHDPPPKRRHCVFGYPKQSATVSVGSLMKWRARSRRHAVNWAESFVDEHRILIWLFGKMRTFVTWRVISKQILLTAIEEKVLPV